MSQRFRPGVVIRSVRVHGGGDENILADHLANLQDVVAFGVFQSFHAHGAVDVEEDAVERHVFAQQFDGAADEAVIGSRVTVPPGVAQAFIMGTHCARWRQVLSS